MTIPVSPWRGALLGVSLLALCPGPARAQAAAPPAAAVVVLPEDLHDQLDDAYPGWAVKNETACDAAGAAAPLLLTADFDNDELADYGLVITKPDGTAHLLAILARVNRAAIHELGAWVESAGATHLRVLPMGRKFRPADTALDDYFSAPTLAAGTCTEAATAYLWTGMGFRATPLK